MKLTKISAAEASARAVVTLGLDADTVALPSREGLAASLRRAASFMCPTSPRRIVDAVLDSLQPLHEYQINRDELVELLDLLVTSGDLLELRETNERTVRLLYLAPPSYIERTPGHYLLMGVRPYGAPIIDTDLAIEHEGHTRSLALDPTDAERELSSRDLQQLPRSRWVASPRQEAPDVLIQRHSQLLNTASEAGDIDGLKVLDPATNGRYYRGRWRAPRVPDAGDFVGRRPQAYGADLWCLVRLENGNARRVLDFPIADPLVPGRDEAWRYQAAVDALRNTPQTYRIRDCGGPGADVFIDFYAPLPGFAERYVKLMGSRSEKTPGALFSFRLPATAVGDVTAFLTNMLWLSNEETNHDD